MARYIFKRFLQTIISLFILGIIIFILVRLAGNPVDLMLPIDASEEARQHMIKQLGLDRPYHIQFYEFIKQTLSGNMGNSIKYGRPTLELFMERFPNTVKLTGGAFLIAFLIAIPLGMLAGSKRATPVDSFIRGVVVIGITAPSFWLGLVLMNVFAVRLGLLPAARMGGIEHYILPCFSLSFFILAGMARLLRSSVIENLDSEYVKMARIKGVSPTMVLWKHVSRNSLIPVVTFAGLYVGSMLSGSIVIETVFAWPGVGRLAYEGINSLDYPLVQAVVIIKGAMVICSNFAVDILYCYIDPRIRYN